jgi:RNA polymerase sigma-70 factor (family 1)
MEHLTKGHDEEFRQLYQKYYRPGVHFLTSILKSREEAENMVQDVFLKMWLRKEKLNFDAHLQAYIFTSLKNIAFDYLKKLAKDEVARAQFLQQMEMAEPTVEEETFLRLSRAVERLSEKRKMIIRMTIEEGKSYQEIAEIMQISKNTVKNQLIKAKQHLRNTVDFSVA